MPVWLVLALIRYVLPAVLKLAYKSGLLTLVEKEFIKFYASLRTYHETDDFPLPSTKQTNQHNFTVGEEPTNWR